ncbi:MAG: flagellar basal body P-ring protein FlgI [Planctomycetaceae bacterium]|nr:flagellar basal body P-ring protein FlgI [Planctomycetaceae bacterium]
MTSNASILRRTCPPAGPRRRRRLVLGLVASAIAALGLVGCGEVVEKVPPRPKQDRVNPSNFVLDVDPMMRGTIASETVVEGLAPVIVRGYGLVVGLKGTGGRLMPAEVRAAMVQELARRGIGNPATSPEGWTPASLLDSPDTAVVIVEGVVPPGSTTDTKFDIRVSALPGTDVTSLEGGRLYTCDLRPGPLLVGSRQAKIIAEAKGNLFINPFVEPGATQKDAVNRLVGRILDGGRVTEDITIKLKLATSSHTRARTIQGAINSSFPRESKQKTETARGENADSIELCVPPSYEKKTEDFIQLVRHLPMEVSATEATALAVRNALIANPGANQAAMWRFRALGKRALPIIQDLYTYGEEDPRMAALEAGAALDDALVVQPLLTMAGSGTVENRLRAIELLGEMGFNPDIDLGLRPLLDDTDVDVRLAAYEALVERKDPAIGIMDIGGKFDVALVPSKDPLIYVAQSGRPTIAVFGDAPAVERPLTYFGWSNRLMVKADAGDEQLQVFYRSSPDARPEIQLADPRLSEFIPFLGHQMTVEKPYPGLGLSYGETIGALHQLWRAGYIKSDFKAEQDRVLAAIIRSQKEDEQVVRPEFEPDEDETPTAATDASDLATIQPPPPVEVPAPGRDTVPR